jgi:hypothetical protein
MILVYCCLYFGGWVGSGWSEQAYPTHRIVVVTPGFNGLVSMASFRLG